jgi:predicted RNA binding protein YcfA (HicA-like mRNA interferase family)
MRVRDLIRMLERDGWEIVRVRGSHRQLRHPIKAGTVTVAGKSGADVPPGTLNAILKQAGLKR